MDRNFPLISHWQDQGEMSVGMFSQPAPTHAPRTNAALYILSSAHSAPDYKLPDLVIQNQIDRSPVTYKSILTPPLSGRHWAGGRD